MTCATRNNLSAHWYRIAVLRRSGQATIEEYTAALGLLRKHVEICPECVAHMATLNGAGAVKEHEETDEQL